MDRPQDAASCTSPNVIDWKRTVLKSLATFAVLLLVSSIALPATVFGASHSTGRSHSASSSHVGSHRSRGLRLSVRSSRVIKRFGRLL
jgi:hypothetical protein